MTETKQRGRTLRAAATLTVCAALGATVLAACGSSGPSHAAAPSTTPTTIATAAATPASTLYSAMSDLWDEHMEYTYDTVLAFGSGSPTLTASLTRLQKNQTDIGNAIKPYYGAQAGDQLAALLHTHIADAVPVLTAAKKGDTTAPNAANAAWYANAKQIGDFLAAANPTNWAQAQMEDMMKTHITQTLAYATDALQGNWTKFISDYDLAQAHMDQMANMLSAGIIAQFPNKFGPVNAQQAALYSAMSDLWDQHMEYTYDTVLAFGSGSPTLTASLTRLQKNQTDIGNAIKPYYGAQAGDQLAALLHTHIADAVPVLTAAKKGDTTALNAANAAWYANAKQIGDFLAAANPTNWAQAQMEDMMKTHITQTLAYATDALQGNWTKFISDYDLAQAHMDQMANMLSAGIIAQFPNKF